MPLQSGYLAPPRLEFAAAGAGLFEAAELGDVRPDPLEEAIGLVLLAQLEELIAAAIAEDLGARDNDVRPQVVAASLTAAFDRLFDRDTPKSRSADEIAALIDRS